jgi:hypothetical protein
MQDFLYIYISKDTLYKYLQCLLSHLVDHYAFEIRETFPSETVGHHSRVAYITNNGTSAEAGLVLTGGGDNIPTARLVSEPLPSCVASAHLLCSLHNVCPRPSSGAHCQSRCGPGNWVKEAAHLGHAEATAHPRRDFWSSCPSLSLAFFPSRKIRLTYGSS